jgi:hypothetical protein
VAVNAGKPRAKQPREIDMNRKFRLTRYAAIAALALVPASGAWSQAIDMKIGFVTINDPQHEASKWFAEEIGKRTNGRVAVRIFPAAQLGGIPRQVEAIQLGTQEAFHTPPAFFVGTTPAFQAADAPGLFDSVEAAIGGIVEQTPSGRLGTVEDMADAVVFLASDQSKFINGVGLPVDGGMGM